jgi:hypothetical protein
MEYNDLLERLDIGTGKDLAYFEQYAELVESDDYISPEALAQLFEEADAESLTELNDSYFEDLLEHVPDEEAELYTLLQTIGRELAGLINLPDGDEATARFSDEFFRFRTWFVSEGEVHCEALGSGSASIVSVLQAITLHRSEHLSDEEYRFDFSKALDYPIDEYIMTLDSFESTGDDDEDDEETYD